MSFLGLSTSLFRGAPDIPREFCWLLWGNQTFPSSPTPASITSDSKTINYAFSACLPKVQDADPSWYPARSAQSALMSVVESVSPMLKVGLLSRQQLLAPAPMMPSSSNVPVLSFSSVLLLQSALLRIPAGVHRTWTGDSTEAAILPYSESSPSPKPACVLHKLLSLSLPALFVRVSSVPHTESLSSSTLLQDASP